MPRRPSGGRQPQPVWWTACGVTMVQSGMGRSRNEDASILRKYMTS